MLLVQIADRKTRKKPEYKMPGYQNVEEGVILSSDRKAVEFGVDVNGQWNYKTLDLKLDMLK